MDYVRESQLVLSFDDKVDKFRRPLYIRRDRPLEQVKMGRFNSHFHQAVTTLLKDTPHADRKIRFYNGQMFIDFEDDIMELISYSETKGSNLLTATPNHEHFQQLGFKEEVIDALIATSMAAAKAAQ